MDKVIHLWWKFCENSRRLLAAIYHCVKSVRISPYSVRMRENADQNNSKCGHFSRSVLFLKGTSKYLWPSLNKQYNHSDTSTQHTNWQFFQCTGCRFTLTNSRPIFLLFRKHFPAVIYLFKGQQWKQQSNMRNLVG